MLYNNLAMCKSFPKTLNITTKFFIFIGISIFLVVLQNALAQTGGIPEKKKGTVVFKPGQEKVGMSLDIHAEEAMEYRAQGLEAQKRGDLDTAFTFYQKAIQLDPNYAVVYNDLGVLYETKGEFDRAEENYHQAIKVDPRYLSPYSNLALLYESKRDFNSAAVYWQKRAELGSLDDPWTAKARARYNAICLTSGKVPLDSREQEIIAFADDIAEQKTLLRKNNTELASYYFYKARFNFQRGNDLAAMKEAINARQLDPANDNVNELIEKLQKRLLSK